MSYYNKVDELQIPLVQLKSPVGAFVHTVQAQGLIFTSGHIAKRDNKPWAGRLGESMTTEQGYEAARGIAVDLVGTLHSELGDLNRMQRIVKLLVLVNSASNFTEQHLVANGASELFQAVFGDAGKHARSAFGVAQIPFGSCVEIDLTAQVR